MALLAELYKAILKAGLLPKIIKSLPILSVLTFIAAWSWLFVLPEDGQYRGTYISENALMPSQAYSYFRESEWNILRGYRTALKEFDVDSVEQNLKTIGSWFDDIGFKTYYQKTEYNTTNLYAIWHAPRADDTEAILLGGAYFQSDSLFNVGGLSLLLSMSRYFHRWSIWSKNIIVVIPQDPRESLRSWVNAYHTSLDHYAGAIESAIIMDYPSDKDNFQYMELYYDGLNGQLPNLDLINTCVMVSEHEGPRISLQKTPESELYTNDYWSRLRILLKGIKNLALAGVKDTVGTEAFSGWRIQALTLKAITDPSQISGGDYDITTFGRIPEAVFRSVNNLLEKFHQSFFFFLMLAPRNFVSIGTYLPSAALVLASFLLSAADNLLNEFSGNALTLNDSFKGLGLVLSSSIITGFFIFQLGFLLPVQATVVILVCTSALIPLGSSLLSTHVLTPEIKPLLRFMALFLFGLNLTSLLTLSFSLTLLIGTTALPLTFVKDYKISFINKILLVISNPFIVAAIASNYEIEDPSLDGNGKVLRFFNNLITSWTKFGNHTWLIIAIGFLPSWLIIAFTTYIADAPDGELLDKKTK